MITPIFWEPNRLCVLNLPHGTGFEVERDEAWGQRLFGAAKAVQTKGERSPKMHLAYGGMMR